MSRVGFLRFLVVGGFVVAVEVLCRTGIISRLVLIAPSEMVVNLVRILVSRKADADIAESLTNVFIAVILSVIGGFALGSVVHSFPRLRRAIDPFLASYYALPFFAFYPLFIVMFGLGRGAIWRSAFSLESSR